MGAFVADTGSSWTVAEQRELHYACPVLGLRNIDRILRQFNQTTGAFEGAIDTQEVDDYSNFGDFASAASGSGLALDSDNPVGVGVYCDDGGAAVGSGVLMRAVRGRVLLTYTDGNREQEVAGVIGQCVSVAGTNRHNMCGVMGSYERSSGTVVVDGQAPSTDAWIQAAIIGRVGVGTSNTTINTNGRLCGVAAMSNTTSLTANNGVYAAFYAGAWGSTLLDWTHGLYLEDSKFTTGVYIGACTTGIAFSGTVGIGVDLSSGTLTTDLKLSNSDTIHNTSSGLITLTATTVTCSGELTCETLTQSGGKGVTGLSIASGGAVTTDGSISADGGFVSGSTPAYHFHGSGAATTMAIYLPSMTKPLLQGTATVAMGGHTNVVEVNAITTTNGAYVFTGGKFITYPSSGDQASVTIYGVYSHVMNAQAIGALRGVYGYLDCSAAKVISNESSALFGDVNVDNNTTVTSDVLSAVHAKVRGDSTLTGTLACVYADAEMSVDAVVKVNVDTSMTATAGLVLSGAGTYTTGIVLSTATFGTAVNIGACTTGILITSASTYAIDIATTGLFRMGVQETGVPLTTTYPFAMEVHCEANSDIAQLPAGTGSSAGIYARYAIEFDQTEQCNHIAMFGKLRVKQNLADGVHAAMYGFVEISGTTVISGTASTQTCAGHFALESEEQLNLSTGHLNGIVVDSSIHAGATIGGTMSGIRIKKSTDKLAWPVAIAIEASACAAGVTIGTMTGTGIDFPSGSTYGAAIRVGTAGTPIVYSSDELVEIHGRVGSATETKPVFRVQNRGYAGGPMTTGNVTACEFLAYSTSTNNIAEFEALRAHVGLGYQAGACTVLANTQPDLPNMRAAWLKIEDLGNDLTLTGDAACIVLAKQWTTGTTLNGDTAFIWLLSEGTVNYNMGAIIEGKDRTGSGLATNLLDIPAAAPWSATNASGDAGKIAILLGGATKYINVYNS